MSGECFSAGKKTERGERGDTEANLSDDQEEGSGILDEGFRTDSSAAASACG
jgi:hypothetical protein